MNAERKGRRVAEMVVNFLEHRGVTKYAVQREPLSITISLPNEPESGVQWYLENLAQLFHASESASDDSQSAEIADIVRDPRDHRTIVIKTKYPGSEEEHRDTIVRSLANEESELRRRGIASLVLFGSAATTKPYPNDVDLLAGFRPDARPSAFDVAGIQLYLEQQLGRRVDLSLEKSFPAEWKKRVEQTGIRIFGP